MTQFWLAKISVIQYRGGLTQYKEVKNQTEQFLELFNQTLNFFAS